MCGDSGVSILWQATDRDTTIAPKLSIKKKKLHCKPTLLSTFPVNHPLLPSPYTTSQLKMHIPLPLLLTLAPSLIPATPIHPRQLNTTTTDTSNQLTDNTPCRPLTLIFARGTFEPGNLGSLTGPPFITALSSAIGASNLAVQGVDYPADVAGFEAGGDVGGSALMAELVGMAMGKCPGTKVVMGGYRCVNSNLEDVEG